MKKFLLKLLLLLALIALPLFALGTYYNHISPVSYEMGSSPEAMPEQIDLAVVGSSHAMYGMKLEQYSENFFSFAMPGQTPQYDWRMLREYEDHIADGATILMDVSYMSPFWTEPESEFLEKQTRYYRVLSKENIVDYDFKDALRVRLNQAIPASRILYTDLAALIGTIQEKGFRTAEVQAEEVPAETVEPTAVWFQDIPHQQDVLRKKHQGLITPVFPDMNPPMQLAYEGMAAMAKEHNWRLIAVTTPFTESYNDIYDQEFFRVFYDYTDQLFTSQGIEYWDYSHDPEFLNAHGYFVDLDHLSPAGAAHFSEILARRLQLIP